MEQSEGEKDWAWDRGGDGGNPKTIPKPDVLTWASSTLRLFKHGCRVEVTHSRGLQSPQREVVPFPKETSGCVLAASRSSSHHFDTIGALDIPLGSG